MTKKKQKKLAKARARVLRETQREKLLAELRTLRTDVEAGTRGGILSMLDIWITAIELDIL